MTTGNMTGIKLSVCTSVKSSGVVQVRVGSSVVSAVCPQDLDVSIKDPVLIGKVGSKYYIIQRYYAAVGNVDSSTIDLSEPPSAPCTITGTTTFVPRKTVSYRAGKWRTDTDDIFQGELHSQGNQTGCAFYGTQIHSALGGATVLSAHLSAKRVAGGTQKAQATTLVHITENSKPSGAPTIGGAYTGPDLSVGTTRTAIVLDTTLVQAMVDGTYGGLGIHDSSGSPYVRLAGKSHYAGAFSLQIKWRRSF